MSTTTQPIEIAGPAAAIGAPPALLLERIRRTALSLCFLTGAFALAAIFGLGLYGYTHDGRIYEGVSAGGVKIGGMNATEARAVIVEAYQPYLVQPVQLTHDGAQFFVVPRDAGIALDADATVASAMSFGREGSFWTRSRAWARSMLHGVELPATMAVDQPRLQQALTTFAGQITVPAADAYVMMNQDGAPTIVDERSANGEQPQRRQHLARHA